jgi:NAD-dependent deacetylase
VTEGVAAAAAALAGARHVAVLTGAGISAESGIPTFRDALTGLWSRYRAEDLATPEAFARDPALVWSWYRMRREAVLAATPNAGHVALARLATLVPRLTLVTQNVDGLHARAGSTDVVELHGSIVRARCVAHGHLADRWDEPESPPPRCATCGAPLRPDVVWFGELLPPDALERARTAAATCDAFLSVGTSNLVEPAASLPWIAAARGAEVIVVNTSMDGQRRGERILHLEGSAATVLPEIVRRHEPGATT